MPNVDTANARVIASLSRLAETLAKLDETAGEAEAADAGTTTTTGDGGDGATAANENADCGDAADSSDSITTVPETRTRGLPLSHWRTLSTEVESAHKMLNEGAEYIKATSTKYTLVGKIDLSEGEKLAEDLRKGCELMSTGTLLIFSPPAGCSRSLRHHARRSSRAVVASVLSLLRSFEDGSARAVLDDGTSDDNRSNPVGAQRTGAVWSACDAVRLQVPKGNRAAMRRELMLWARDCNESTEEFEELLQSGPRSSSPAPGGGGEGGTAAVDEDAGWDDFCANAGTGDQYSHREMGVALSCVNLVKCSRNVLSLALKACECAGQAAEEGESDDNHDDEHGGKRKRDVLQWISDLHELSRRVGEGVTNLGVLLYPPLDFTDDAEGGSDSVTTDTPNVGRSVLGLQIASQIDAVTCAVNCILDATPNGGASSTEIINMTEEVAKMAGKLQKAIQTRTHEAEDAMR